MRSMSFPACLIQARPRKALRVLRYGCISSREEGGNIREWGRCSWVFCFFRVKDFAQRLRLVTLQAEAFQVGEPQFKLMLITEAEPVRADSLRASVPAFTLLEVF